MAYVLGHLGEHGMMELHNKKLLKGIKICKLEFCKYYVHIDIWGIVHIVSLGGSVYFVSFIDNYSRKVWVYFMWHKSETFAKFK